MEHKIENIEYARYIVIQKKQALESLLLSSDVNLQESLKLEIIILDAIDNYLLEKLRDILY